MSSLFMYHTLRKHQTFTIMFDVSDGKSIGSGLCVGISQESLSQQSWHWSPNQSPAIYTSSEDIQSLINDLSELKQMMKGFVAGNSEDVSDEFDGPVFKKVSCCSPLCSFLSWLMMLFSLSPEEVPEKIVGLCFPSGKVRL